MNWQLSYEQERWLYETNRRAWGYHKALVNEDHAERRKRLLAVISGEDMGYIREAYKNGVTATRERVGRISARSLA